MEHYSGRVRIIEADEIEDVMRLCNELWSENGIFKMDDTKVRQMLMRAFNKEGGILAGVGPKGRLEGLLYLLLSSFWYTNDHHWEELFLYVSPEYRKSRNAVELLKFAKWCATQTPYPLFIGIMPNAASQRKIYLYDRQLNSDIAAQDDLNKAMGMLEALKLIDSKSLGSSIGNVKKVAEERLKEAESVIKQASTQKGCFFIYSGHTNAA